MNFLIHIVTLIQILSLYISCLQAQRVPPGVHPQHYQQQQQQFQQPQYQQQAQYQQQVPVQQVPVQQQQQAQHQVPGQQVLSQQVPVQQGHVPQGHGQQGHGQQVHGQQVPVQQGHGHGHHQQGKILDAQHIMQEKDHIAEHMDVPLDTSKMTEQELQFHYFKMHDADNNNKLDGCELIKSLIHWHEQGSKDPTQTQIEDKIFKDDELVTLIDPILNMDDNNMDGYIDYPEFIRAQQKVSSSQNNRV